MHSLIICLKRVSNNSLDNQGFGTFCVNWGSSRRPPARLSVLKKSWRRSPWKSRTLASGWDTTPVPVPTTCTANTVTWLWPLLSLSVTATWVPVIVPGLTVSKSSVLSLWPLAKLAGLWLSRCMIPKSSSLCHPVCKSPRDLCSRPRDPTPTSCNFFLALELINTTLNSVRTL